LELALRREPEWAVIVCGAFLKMVSGYSLKEVFGMKHLATILICVVLTLCVRALAQTTAQAGAQSSDQASSTASTSSSAAAQANHTNAGLASGITFNAALNTPIDSKKAKASDSVIAHTTESVKSDGKTVLPKGTKLVGHVTQASARAKGDSESSLAIAFDHAILRNGSEVPLSVVIQALASAQAGATAQEREVDAIAGAGASEARSGMGTSRGTLVGKTSTAGSAVGTLANTSAAVGSTGAGAVNSAVNSATGPAGASRGAVGGLNAAGQLTSNSRGVFGLNGLSLSSETANNARGSVITSAGKNVRLEGGARMLIVTQAASSAAQNL
jgi:hypothetical protein